jgi:hypothetical protein
MVNGSQSKTASRRDVKSKGSVRKAPHRALLRTDTSKVLVDARTCAGLRVKEEKKASAPRYRGSDYPLSLTPVDPGYVAVDTKESLLVGSVLSRMFAGRVYPFRLATVLNMSSSGTGIVNSIIATSSIQFNGDFIALSGVFNEFFVSEMRVAWEPVSMYNFPLTGTAATSVSSLPLGVASLQHSQPVYTSLATMAENYEYAHHNTGRPFAFKWKNVESKNSTVVVAPVSTGSPVQSWAMCTDVASYTGTLQFLTQSAPPALPVTQVLGTFLVEYLVWFRVRF